TREKGPIKDLYRDFKDLDRQLAAISAAGGGGDDDDDPSTIGSSAPKPGAAVDSDVPADMESVKAEKKRVKHDIQTWLDDFEAREGRAALQGDKAAIRPLYKRHKELERELSRRLAASSTNSDAAATSPSASQLDTPKYDIDSTPMLLSPASSAGEIPVTAASSQDEEESADKAIVRNDSAVDGENGTNEEAPPLSSGGEEECNTSSGGGGDGDGDGNGDGDGDGDGGGDGDSGKIPMTAQEARVKRMRARFLDMKVLIEGEESALPSSPTSAGGKSPRQELGFGLPDAEGEDTSARNRWALLGDAIAPNRLSSPSSRASAQRDLTYGTETKIPDTEEGKNNPVAASTAQQSASIDGAEEGASKQSTAEAGGIAPLADDGVSSAWVSGQMSNLLLSDAPPPPPPVPPGLEDLETEASRLGAAVDPPTPGFAAEYQSGVRGAELVVASVSVEEVRARERVLQLERLANAREETNVYRAREANLLYREDRARRRVLAYQREIERKATVEKQAVIEISIAGERALAPAFARARRGLERAIQAQAGRVREVFGELRPRETPGGRRFRVDWKGVPQPVE
ncbi:unnamed protein product, partial [Hapterophycus canaliculatus]